MGQTIKAITQEHYSDGLDLAKQSIKELYGIEKFDPIDFNFKVKNLFVLPGNITRGIFIDGKMIGFFIMSEHNILWNNDKKLSIDFFYAQPEFRTRENMDTIYNYVEDYALTHKFSSIMFNDQLPFFANHICDNNDVVKLSTQYEKDMA